MTPTQSPRVPPLLVLILGVLTASTSAVLIRLAQDEAPSMVIAAMRTTLATLILLPFAVSRRPAELRHIGQADWRLILFAGLMLGLHFATWVTSLEYTAVSSATVLVTTTPLWVGLASPFFLGEPLSRPIKIGIVLAVLGSLVISVGDLILFADGRLALHLGSAAGGRQPWLGNGLALLGAISGAAYFMVGRRLRPRLSLLSYVTLVYGVAGLCLLLAMIATGGRLAGYSLATYLLFLALAIGPQLLGHSSYNWALGYLSAAYVSVAIVSEPISASVLAWLVFQELPGPPVLFGSLLIFAGILASSRRG